MEVKATLVDQLRRDAWLTESNKLPLQFFPLTDARRRDGPSRRLMITIETGLDENVWPHMQFSAKRWLEQVAVSELMEFGIAMPESSRARAVWDDLSGAASAARIHLFQLRHNEPEWVDERCLRCDPALQR